MLEQLWLAPLGFAVGAFGTLIGAGGGFVLMPILLLLYPEEAPEKLTSISLAVVFFNALSGSWAYGRMGRIDYRSGLVFAAAAVPGAVAGAILTDHIPRRPFDAIFGALMIAACVFLLLRRKPEGEVGAPGGSGGTARRITDAQGNSHSYRYDMRIGATLSVFVGLLSSLLGIGGGIIHVPGLVHLLGFPVHIATATSHFILAIVALTGTLVHVMTGTLADGLSQVGLLAVGVVFGAQVGAWLSLRVHGRWIMRALGAALGFVGLRILLKAVV